MSNLVKKTFLFLVVVLSCLFISNFASANTTNMMNSMHNGVEDVRNAVGGAENMVENAAKDTTTTVKDGLENMGNSAQNMMNGSTYSADRTATGGATTRSAMETATGNNIWTWVIVGVVALMIIGIIWYMVSRNNNSK
mgnify:CR=1 FL=1